MWKARLPHIHTLSNQERASSRTYVKRVSDDSLSNEFDGLDLESEDDNVEGRLMKDEE